VKAVPQSGVLNEWNGKSEHFIKHIGIIEECSILTAPLKRVVGVCGFWGVKRWLKNTAANKKAIQLK
jgi:hypothetical protein